VKLTPNWQKDDEYDDGAEVNGVGDAANLEPGRAQRGFILKYIPSISVIRQQFLPDILFFI